MLLPEVRSHYRNRHFPHTTLVRISTATANNSYRTTISYLLRVPRKLRPVLLIGMVLITTVVIMLTHASGRATELDRFREQRLAMLQGQTFVQKSLAKQDEGQLAMAALSYNDVHPGAITQLTPDEELAALLAFITSTTANALPPLDPTVPLEPSVILDFDYTKSTAQSDLKILMDDVISRYPVVLVGRMRDPWHREIKKLLSSYKIKPSPLIIDVDQRLDQDIMIPLLARLLDTPTLPQLVVSLTPVGSYPEVMELRDSGEFTSAIASAGAYITASKHNAKGAQERLRHENERLLAPGPVLV